MDLQKILKRKGYEKIKLTKLNTNHFQLNIKINGVEGNFILDTGASNSCVGMHLAEHFKLQVKDSKTKAAGAGAVGMETKIANKNFLKIKGWEYKSFVIVLLDLSHVNTALVEHGADPIEGILGADILETGKAIIDYKNKCLFLKKRVYKF